MSIQLKNITKTYGAVWALNDISLECKSGKTTVLIGPSGCGKSTTIRIVTGLIKSDLGEVLINGNALHRDNLTDMRKKMGYVIQEGGLFPHLTGKENVSLLAGYLGWEKNKINHRITELAELTNFPVEGLNRFPAELSGGQKQRVSLMRALMLDPPILLLDEPLGALDPLIRYDLQEDLKSIFKKLNKTVVLVTHDMNEAGFFGDEIVLMKDGIVIQKGSLEDLLTSPADPFVSRFIKAQHITVNLPGNT